MNRLVFLLVRRPEFDRTEFQRRWWEHHAPLVAARAELLGIQAYQQVHTLPDVEQEAAGWGPAPYDGIAELWIDPERARGSRHQQRQAGAELLDDERQFIELSSSPIWTAHELVMRPGPGQGPRLSSVLYRRPGISRSEFRRHWREVHGPLVLASAEPPQRYVQLHTPDGAEDSALARARHAPPPPDGLLEVCSIVDDVGSADHQRRLADEERFCDRTRNRSWLGEVRPVIGAP